MKPRKRSKKRKEPIPQTGPTRITPYRLKKELIDALKAQAVFAGVSPNRLVAGILEDYVRALPAADGLFN